MYESTCQSCQVIFHVNQPTPTKPPNSWKLFGITYRLNDPDLYELVMHLDTEFTIIWFKPVAPEMKHISLPTIFPFPQPQDAPALARRILNLKVFS